MKVPVKNFLDDRENPSLIPQPVHINKNKIQLDKEEEEEEKTFKKMKELHSDCSLYERWLRDFLSTYVLEIVRANVYLYDVSHNKQQQEAIRWYNNWPPSPFYI